MTERDLVCRNIYKIIMYGQYKRAKVASDAVCVADTFRRATCPEKRVVRIFPGPKLHAHRGNFLVHLVNINSA